jgi:aminopeptidase N
MGYLRSTAVAATVIALIGVPAGAAPDVPSPGSPGAGDVYYPDYGNGGYDVDHYDIRLRYWPGTDKLAGTTTITGHATKALSRFNLDFALDVASVRVNNRPATFAAKRAHELVVTPERSLARGEPLTVVVKYSGIPSEVEVYGFTAYQRVSDGAQAGNEPENAWWWYPSNDHPTDKATFDINVQVPNGVEVISNGVQPVPPDPTIPGWQRWYWRTTSPTATYLAFLDIGQYEIRTDTMADGTPLITAYAENLGGSAGAARASVERTAEIIEWGSNLFGPYPFEAAGGVAGPIDGYGFSLETQTRPMYGSRAFDDGANTSIVVHELAHQWFGDSVAVAQWKDIWLNEGFASYAQWMWSEDQGEGTTQEIFDYTYHTAYPADDPFWQVPPGDPGADDLFNGAVYDRGAMTLHVLRQTIGDQAFFRLLRAWPTRHHDGNATTAQLVAMAERISGQELSELFDTWLYTPGRPELTGPAATTRRPAAERPASWMRIHEAYAATGRQRRSV